MDAMSAVVEGVWSWRAHSKMQPVQEDYELMWEGCVRC